MTRSCRAVCGRARGPSKRRRSTPTATSSSRRISGSGSCRRPCATRGFRMRWDADMRQEQVYVEDRCCCPPASSASGLAGRPFEDIGTGVRYSELMPGGFDPRARLRDMDAEGIDVAVLYPSVGLFLEAIEDPSRRCLLSRLQRLARRLLPRRAAAPRRHRGRADAGCRRGGARDAARRRRARHARRVHPSQPVSRPRPARPSFDPFWAAGAELGVPVGLHPPAPAIFPERCRASASTRRSWAIRARFLHRQLHRLLAPRLRRRPRTPSLAPGRRPRGGRRVAGALVRPLRPLRPRLRLDGAGAEAQAERVLQAPVLRSRSIPTRPRCRCSRR